MLPGLGLKQERTVPEAHDHIAAVRVVVRARPVERQFQSLGCVVEDPELLLAVRVLRADRPELSALASLVQHLCVVECDQSLGDQFVSTRCGLAEPSSA